MLQSSTYGEARGRASFSLAFSKKDRKALIEALVLFELIYGPLARIAEPGDDEPIVSPAGKRAGQAICPTLLAPNGFRQVYR